MITLRLSAVLRVIAPCLGFFAAAVAAPPPASDFARWPEVNSVRISEDGRYVSFLTPSKRRFFDLNIFDLQTKKSNRYALGGDDVISYKWIDASRLLVTTEKRPIYWFRQVVFDANEGKVTTYMSELQQYFDVLSSLRRDPHLFVARFYKEGRYSGADSGLAIINTKLRPIALAGVTNRRYNVKEWINLPKGEYHDALTDNDGDVRLVLIYESGLMQYHYRRGTDEPWITLPLETEFAEIVGFDDDPDYLYISLYSTEARSSRLHRYRVSANDPGPALFEDPTYSTSTADLTGVRQSNGRFRVLALTYPRDYPVQRSVDPEFSAIQKEINDKLPGRLNLVSSCDRDLKRIVIQSSSGREPPRYLVYDRTTKGLMALPPPTPWFDASTMSVMRPVKYTARDGLVLEGYLSMPAQRADGGKPPLVVCPHGGPWVRDIWGYDSETQFLTSRGYAVFQPNYRGSAGYSKAVSKDDDFEFRKMHDDVTDGVKYLVAQGLVDDKRLAIYGGSFGGYLAVAGVAFEPDLYRCAITFAGVFDWKQMIRQRWTNADDDKFNYDLLVRKLGDPAKQQARFEELSPINHVAAIKAPVFVVHGKLDAVVDYDQSKKLLSELSDHKIPHEKLFFEDEYHGFQERENYQKFLEALEVFLARNL